MTRKDGHELKRGLELALGMVSRHATTDVRRWSFELNSIFQKSMKNLRILTFKARKF